MNYAVIPPIIAVTAALVSVITLFPLKQDALPQSRYRQMYDEASVDRDNLLGFIVRDHDARAAATDAEYRHVVQGNSKTGGSKTYATWDGGDLGSGDVAAFENGQTTTIVTIDAKKGGPAKTTYYLADDKSPYLVARERPVSGADAPFVDRWYFEAGQYVTYRSSDPTQKAGTLQYTYTPTGKDDLNRLKAQLSGALDALSLSHSPS
jgi:hypothetical protein